LAWSKDVRQNDFIAEPKMQMYFAYRQTPSLMPNALIVRTAVDPLSLASSVRNAIWAVDKDQTVANIDSMEHIVAGAWRDSDSACSARNFRRGRIGSRGSRHLRGDELFGRAANARDRIRMALGAQRSDVLKMTIKQGLKLVGLGLVIGLAVAFILTRVMATLLFGISATDPLTFITISFVLLVVAMLASYIPSVRAMRVDPMSRCDISKTGASVALARRFARFAAARMLTISQVTKAFGGRTLFEEASLQVNRGDRIGLVGPNGAGKSTLFSLILGDALPDEGRISLEKSRRLDFFPRNMHRQRMKPFWNWPAGEGRMIPARPRWIGRSSRRRSASLRDSLFANRIRTFDKNAQRRLGDARASGAPARPGAGASSPRRADEPSRFGIARLVPGILEELSRRDPDDLARP